MENLKLNETIYPIYKSLAFGFLFVIIISYLIQHSAPENISPQLRACIASQLTGGYVLATLYIGLWMKFSKEHWSYLKIGLLNFIFGSALLIICFSNF